VRINTLFKYLFRFVILQVTLTLLTIWYFDNFLIGDYFDGFIFISENLLEDKSRFYPFVPNDFIKIDIYLAVFIFVFLIFLYLSKFYSYVNELTFSANKGLFDEFFSIYLIWTASFLSFLQLFRFDTVSRGYTIIFSFVVPLLLVAFRNSEFISSLLGRNPTKETLITFNLDSESIFSELRLLSFRNLIAEFINDEIEDYAYYKKNIESFNKDNEINLIVFNFSGLKSISLDFEKYLLNLNKKLLIIADPSFEFNSSFIIRSEVIAKKSVFYINNDIQYGSRYISKRLLDLVLILIFLPILFLLSLLTMTYILIIDGRPSLIKQTRVGLHGKNFDMYKFRTMKINSHNERSDLDELNQQSGPLFKIDDDPRIIKGAKSLRKFSLDELPQLLNVLKGQMSLVGPRPLFPEDNKYFDENYIRRLNVLPGITGLLQINERNTSDFEIWYKYDIEYIENWSLLLDIKILLKTPISLMSKKIIGK
jgi:lipopolysaccharide/colanic/teichoic acid biosynthesis glycosyltransferase